MTRALRNLRAQLVEAAPAAANDNHPPAAPRWPGLVGRMAHFGLSFLAVAGFVAAVITLVEHLR